MPSIRELFDLARQYHVKSKYALNPDVREALRSKGDDYMQKADELRRGFQSGDAMSAKQSAERHERVLQRAGLVVPFEAGQFEEAQAWLWHDRRQRQNAADHADAACRVERRGRPRKHLEIARRSGDEVRDLGDVAA